MRQASAITPLGRRWGVRGQKPGEGAGAQGEGSASEGNEDRKRCLPARRVRGLRRAAGEAP